MPYALIPDGYSLKKVTKLQKEAVKAKRRHDNVQAFIENENTPFLVGAGALALSVPFLMNLLLQAQEDALNITLTDKQKTDLVNYANLSLGPVGIAQVLGRKIGKGLLEFELPTFEDVKAGATGP
jgi:hypothetical protein